MNEDEITSVLENCGITQKFFAGVVSQDQLSLLQPSRPSFYIVNTDTEGGPGLHWTSIFVTKDNCCEFFYSLAKPPGQYSDNFVDFLIENGPNYLMSTKQIQSFDSTACGQFCIFYAVHRCLAYSFEEIIDMFSATDLLSNDIKVRKFVNKMM